VQSACTKTEDGACLQRAYEHLVTYYPKAQYWQNLVDAMYHQQSGADANLLQVYRLAAAVDVLKKPSDFTEYAQLALDAGSAGEAKSVLEKGFEKKVFIEKRDVDRNNRRRDRRKGCRRPGGRGAEGQRGRRGQGRRQDVSVGAAWATSSTTKPSGHQPWPDRPRSGTPLP
jgi:hypothetical protein